MIIDVFKNRITKLSNNLIDLIFRNWFVCLA